MSTGKNTVLDVVTPQRRSIAKDRPRTCTFSHAAPEIPSSDSILR